MNNENKPKETLTPDISYTGSWGSIDPWVGPVSASYDQQTQTYSVSMDTTLYSYTMTYIYNLRGEQSDKIYADGYANHVQQSTPINFQFTPPENTDPTYILTLSCTDESGYNGTKTGTAIIENVALRAK